MKAKASAPVAGGYVAGFSVDLRATRARAPLAQRSTPRRQAISDTRAPTHVSSEPHDEDEGGDVQGGTDEADEDDGVATGSERPNAPKAFTRLDAR